MGATDDGSTRDREPGDRPDRGDTPGRRRRHALTLTVALAALLALSGCLGVGGVGLGGGESASAPIGFENVTAEAGLDYRGQVEAGFGNGNAGVYVTDFDRDARPDLLLVGADRPALYHNANGSYERSDALPSLNDSYKSAAALDWDGDGWEDLILFRGHGRPTALHNAEGRFERADLGLGNLSYPLGAAAADYDGDGDRDLFVYQSGDWRERTPEGRRSLNASIADDNGYPNLLYENTDDGFRRVGEAGIEGDRWSLAATFADLTGDGLPDIHVANDYNNDTVYVNEGDGTFDQRLLGGATARNGMASEVADVTGDGRQDVFVTNIEIELSEVNMSAERRERIERLMSTTINSQRTRGNTLLINEGDDGRFADRAPAYGVRDGGWGWAASFVDLDDDGDRDLVHTTQYITRFDRENPVYTYPMVFERNGTGPGAANGAGEGNGFTRLDASAIGLNESDGRGMATLDYDGDGDRDLVVADYGGRFRLYENVADGGSALDLRVVDENGATALGATVRVEAADGDSSWNATVHGRTDFLSQDSRVVHVGLGEVDTVDLTVTWPDGTERTFEDVAADRRLRVTKQGLTVVRTHG